MYGADSLRRLRGAAQDLRLRRHGGTSGNGAARMCRYEEWRRSEMRSVRPMRQAVRALLTTAMTLGIFAGLGYGVQKVNLRGAATAAKEEVCLWIPMRRPPPRCLPDGFRRPPTARGPARLTPVAHRAHTSRRW